jgi:hypothetical protein
LRALALPWADDPSNATDAYLRNRLRHHVLPPLAAASPNGSLSGMARTLTLLRSDADALSSLCHALIARAGHWTPEPAWYGRLSLLGPPAVTAQVIRRVSRQLCPGHSPSSLAVDEALSRLSSAGRAPWRDGAVEIGREGQWLVLRAPQRLAPPPSLQPCTSTCAPHPTPPHPYAGFATPPTSHPPSATSSHRRPSARVMRQLQSGGGKAMNFGKSKAKLLNESTEQGHLRGRRGVEEAKEELRRSSSSSRTPRSSRASAAASPRACC